MTMQGHDEQEEDGYCGCGGGGGGVRFYWPAYAALALMAVVIGVVVAHVDADAAIEGGQAWRLYGAYALLVAVPSVAVAHAIVAWRIEGW